MSNGIPAMDDRRRFAVATAIAPLTVPARFLIAQLFAADNRTAIWFVGVFSTATAYLGTLLVGVPVVFLLRRTRLLNVYSLGLAGSIGGILVFLVFSKFLGFFLSSFAPFRPLHVWWGLTLGLIVSLVFCALAGISWRSSGRMKDVRRLAPP